MKPSAAPSSIAQHFVGDFFARCDEGQLRRRDGERDLAQRRPLPPRPRLVGVGRRTKTFLAEVSEIRERRVRIILREIVMVEEAAEIDERLLYAQKIANGLIFRVGGKIRTSSRRRP